MLLNDVKGMSDKEILDELQVIGISTALEEFKEAALKVGGPSTSGLSCTGYKGDW